MVLLTIGHASWISSLAYRGGAGIEDGEGNECLYSESNALAPIVCHTCSYYGHLQSKSALKNGMKSSTSN